MVGTNFSASHGIASSDEHFSKAKTFPSINVMLMMTPKVNPTNFIVEIDKREEVKKMNDSFKLNKGSEVCVSVKPSKNRIFI